MEYFLSGYRPENPGYWLERTTVHPQTDAPVNALRDINGEPFSRSLTDYTPVLEDTRNDVSRRLHKTSLHKLVWRLPKDAIGPRDYVSRKMLDQLMIRQSLSTCDSPLRPVKPACFGGHPGASTRMVIATACR